MNTYITGNIFYFIYLFFFFFAGGFCVCLFVCSFLFFVFFLLFSVFFLFVSLLCFCLFLFSRQCGKPDRRPYLQCVTRVSLARERPILLASKKRVHAYTATES